MDTTKKMYFIAEIVFNNTLMLTTGNSHTCQSATNHHGLWPPISTVYVSAALCLRHACRADAFHFSLCVNPHQVRYAAYLLRPSSGSPEPSGTDTQDFYLWWMPEHDAAIQLNLAQSRQEVKRRNNKQHPVTFQNKTLRVDTSTQISKKRQSQALLLILRSGTLRVVVFNNTDL